MPGRKEVPTLRLPVSASSASPKVVVGAPPACEMYGLFSFSFAYETAYLRISRNSFSTTRSTRHLQTQVIRGNYIRTNLVLLPYTRSDLALPISNPRETGTL